MTRKIISKAWLAPHLSKLNQNMYKDVALSIQLRDRVFGPKTQEGDYHRSLIVGGLGGLQVGPTSQFGQDCLDFCSEIPTSQ